MTGRIIALAIVLALGLLVHEALALYLVERGGGSALLSGGVGIELFVAGAGLLLLRLAGLVLLVVAPALVAATALRRLTRTPRATPQPCSQRARATGHPASRPS